MTQNKDEELAGIRSELAMDSPHDRHLRQSWKPVGWPNEPPHSTHLSPTDAATLTPYRGRHPVPGEWSRRHAYHTPEWGYRDNAADMRNSRGVSQMGFASASPTPGSSSRGSWRDFLSEGKLIPETIIQRHNPMVMKHCELRSDS